MKAMILAAGLGTRMRPLTDHTPKPLLKAGGKPLIVWHLEKLAAAGFKDVVINIAWLGWQIPEALGDGSQWDLKLHYSDEQTETALETAGGIIKALPLLGSEPFLVVNGDIWCDYACLPHTLPPTTLAHLILVDNPEHHPAGDFALEAGRARNTGEHKLTFSGIGYYHPELFAGLAYGKRALGPVLRTVMEQDLVSAEHYQGNWLDIGTPERLAQLDQQIQYRPKLFDYHPH
ncbi:N-acetylmuramate alpha-1-phosphate uridylyltransferase MurU [uncultured Thiothrix sp.]|uniref:N-acetylmuramate alpha-1-phosphate uridylyltransferase MurU n=1 Tax=uncultured Thiothrix sp. TaxID=223185 RepID=UPI002616DCDF|nr:nucleotidyltransferase family protein [uncultured Thiothrix sp.]